MPDKLTEIYNAYKADGVTKAQSEQQFRNWMAGKNYRAGIYNDLKRQGAKLGTFEEFSERLGYKQKSNIPQDFGSLNIGEASKSAFQRSQETNVVDKRHTTGNPIQQTERIFGKPAYIPRIVKNKDIQRGLRTDIGGGYSLEYDDNQFARKKQDDISREAKELNRQIVKEAADVADKLNANEWERILRSNARGNSNGDIAALSAMAKEFNERNGDAATMNKLIQAFSNGYFSDANKKLVEAKAKELGVDPYVLWDKMMPGIEQAVRDRYVEKNMPKNEADYVVRGLKNSLLGQIGQRFVTTSDERELINEGEQRYAEKLEKEIKDKGVVSLAGAAKYGNTALGMAADILPFSVAGAGSKLSMQGVNAGVNFITKTPLGKRLLGRFMGTTAKELTEKYGAAGAARIANFVESNKGFFGTLLSDGVKGTLQSGLTLGNYGAMSYLVGEGADKIEKGDTKNWVGGLLSSYGDEFLTGLKFGAVGAVGSSWGRRVGITGAETSKMEMAKNALKKAAITTGAFAAESLAFRSEQMWDEWSKDHKVDVVDNFIQGACENLAMKIGSGHIKSWHPANILRSMTMSGVDNRLVLSSAEKKEFLANTNARNLLEACEALNPDRRTNAEMGIEHKPNYRHRSLGGHDTEGNPVGYLQQFLEDKTISFRTRQKVAAALGGVISKEVPRTSRIVVSEDNQGIGVVKAYAEDGELLSIDTCRKGEAEAKKQELLDKRDDRDFKNAYNSAITSLTDDESAEIGEQAAKELGYKSYADYVEKNANMTSLNTKAEKKKFDEAVKKKYAAKVGEKTKAVLDIQREIGEEFGLDMDKVIAKDPVKRTDEEKKAIAEFNARLRDRATDKNNEKQQSQLAKQNGADKAEQTDVNNSEEFSAAAAEVNNRLTEASTRWMQMLETNPDLAEWVKANPDADVSEMRELFGDEAADAYLELSNAQAAKDGFTNHTGQKIEDETQKQVEQSVFTGTINGEEDKDNVCLLEGQNGESYVLVGGEVTIDENGKIELVSDGGIAIVRDEKGNIVQLTDLDGYKANRVSMEDYANTVRTGLQEQKTKEIQASEPEAPTNEEGGEKPSSPSGGSEDRPNGENRPNISIKPKGGDKPDEPKGNGGSVPPANGGEKPNTPEGENKPSEPNENGGGGDEPEQPTFRDGAPVPMDENGEPDFNKMSPEQGAELYRDTFGGEAEKLLDDEIKKAEKDLKNAQKMKVGGSSWSEKKASMEAKEEAEAEAQRRLEMLENIKKTLTAKKVEEGMGEKPANSGANDERTARAKTKFDNAPKLKGRHGTRTLSNGMKLSGTFYIVSAESLTPSHNALDGYKKNEDFPVTEDGKTANNRDYESDKDAQTVTDGIANNYDGQAVSQVPVVSDEGVVYDGNGRTMAGQKAAVNGKDKAYTESLIENIEGFGVTAEELEKSGVEHPRVVFVLDERLPYDTKTFALFNKQEKKTQNNTNVAIENSKKLTPKEIGSIIAEISENKTLDSFFNSPKAINNLIKTLVYKGIIGQNEVAGLKDGDLLSAAGEEFVENLLLGSFFKEETIKKLGIEKGLKRKVLSAIKSVMDNAKLGEYNLGDEIDQAVQLLYEAKRYGSKVATLLREQDFVNGNAADRYPTASQIMALALEGKVDDFRELIEIYNNTVNGRVEGKVDLFGDTPTKEEILNEVLKLEGWSKYGIKPKETKQEGHDDVGGSKGTEPQTRGKGEGNGGGVGGNKLKLRIPLNSPEVNPDDPIETAAALYRKDHPLIDEDILNTTAFDDLPEDRKQYCIDAALDYLHGEDDSAISEAYYRQIYANRKPTRPKGNGGEGKTDAPIDPQQKGTQYKSDKNGGEKPATPLGGTKKTEKPKEKTREELEAEKNAADDEFDAFMKDLRKKRGGQLNSGFIDQHLIEAAPKMFSLAAKCAYTRIKLGMFDAKEIIKDLKARFKEAFDGFDKKDIETFYSEIMKQKWRDGNERMSLNDWAEHYKKLSPEHQKKLAGDSKLAEEKKQKENVFISNLKMIMGGRNVDGIRELRQLAKELGLEGVKDTDLQELAETAVVSRARDIASSKAMSEERKFAEMKKLYENQPTFSQRDSERVAKQQYSTPAPYAYLANMYVKGNGKEINSALEPSAGNGMLTIGLPIDKVHVNDIDEVRVLNLNRQGFKIVTSQDGTQPFGDKNVDVVVTNPPFGTTTPRDYDGYKISSLEGQMAINALESMKDDGRAAIIIGGKTEYAQNGSLKPKDKAFLGYLYSHYNVEDVINVDGSLYVKQGTTYPTRIILINGRRLNENSFPPVKDKAKAETVKDYDELYKRINDDLLRSGRLDTTSGEGTRKVRPESDKQSTDDSDGKGLPIRGGKRGKHEATDVSSGLSGEGMVRLGENGLGNGRGAERGTEGGLSEGDTGANTTRTEPSQSEGGKYRPNRIRRVQEQGGSGRTASQPNANGTSDVGRGRLAVKEKEERDLTSEKVTYTPKSGNPFTLQSVMPADQQEAVNRNLEKLGDVDQFLINELGYNDKEDLYKHLAAEQIDAVAMAIHQAQQGNGFIIGDMTGIGKGRQAASLIRYAKRQGQVPIYFTKTAGLLSDVYRDLVDIGSSELRPFVFGSSNEAAITDSDGNVVYKLPSKKEEKRVLDYIEKNGKLPEEYDYVLTTYSQVQNGLIEYGENGSRKENGKKPTPAALNGQRKRDAIEKLVGNGYLILDESHTAGGDSSQGNYFQHIIQKTKSVTFFSATFAKRPDNMPIYALRTAMNKGGLKASELIEAVRRGGTTLQEVMSRALTECGQMIRRERDMTGVTIDWKAIDNPEKVEEQRAQYDSIIGLFNDIINFQKTYVNEYIDKENTRLAAIQASMDIKRGTAALGIKNTPFASKAFNTVQQVLLSLKAKSAAERAVEYLKKDMKPVIALSNTNESQAGGIALGEEMDAPDLSVSLKKGLAGTLRYTTKGAKNDSESGYIKLSDLGEEATKAYYELEKKIEQSSTGLSLSPIDVIKNVIEGAGYKVGELTGRTTEFVYNENGTVTKVKRTETDKKKLARQFNDGELDALILNKSAATGISLHASSKFKDTKKRVMIVAQQQLDVNDEVQMRGRIDRTGQLLRGAYEYVVSLIPAEQRLLMMFKAKLKSLDANTTSSQKSKFNEMEVADITNKYGDSVVREYMAEHLDLYAKMADPFGWESAYGGDLEAIDPQKLVTTRGDVRNGEAGQDANKLLGRMALLKVAEQEKMLQEISDLYAAEINRLSEMGENDLEITEIPLKAKTLDKAIWRKGLEPNGDNAFADNTYVEKVNMAVLRKPMKAEEVKKAQDGLTGEKTWEEYKEEKKAAVKAYYDQKIEEATQKNEERAVKLATKAREKYIKDAKRGQKNSGMSDEQIEKMADFQYKNIYDGEKEKLDTIVKNLRTKADAFERVLDTFSTEEAYALPVDMNNPSEMSAFGNSYGRLIDIKITDNFSPNASSVSFATMDGRRKVTFPISGKVGKGDSKTDVITSISTMTKQAVSAGDKHLKVLAMDAANWDRLTPNENRKDGYIITGNLIQALADTSARGVGGQLVKYTTDTGEVKTGILMSERFEPKAIHNDVPISEMTDKIHDGIRHGSIENVTSSDGEVKITWRYDYIKGGLSYQIRVPKSQKRGGKYFMDKGLLDLVEGKNFETRGNSMMAEFREDSLRPILDRLSKLGVKVQEEKTDTERYQEAKKSEFEQFMEDAPETENIKTSDRSAMQKFSDRVLSFRSAETKDYPTYNAQKTTVEIKADNLFRSEKDWFSWKKYGNSIAFHDKENGCSYWLSACKDAQGHLKSVFVTKYHDFKDGADSKPRLQKVDSEDLPKGYRDERYQKTDGTTEMSEREKTLRDAVVETMKSAGLDVSMDVEEGQRVLDEANGKVRMSAKKRRALETVSVSQDEKHQPTVVSSANGAKVLKELDSTKEKYENQSNRTNTFIGDVAKALGAQRYGSSSEYVTFETKNGRIVTIRLANHNAKVSNFDANGEPEGISIVVTAKQNERMTDDGMAHVVEYYYDAIKLRRADGKPLAEIVRSIKQALYSGEFKDTTGLAERQEVNADDVTRYQKVYHGSGAEFDHFDHSHMGEGEGAQAYGWGTYVTEVEGIGRTYAKASKYNIQLRISELEANISRTERSLPFLKGETKEEEQRLISQWKEELDKLRGEEEKGQYHLYTVEIPDDTGENYLSWDKPLTEKQFETINKALAHLMDSPAIPDRMKEKLREWNDGHDPVINILKGSTGKQVYEAIKAEILDEYTSKFLSSLGFAGIKYPADYLRGGREDGKSNYVIFNEKDAKITDHVRFFRTKDGEAYGYTIGGKIYIDPRIANSETPVHEYAHLWATALRSGNAEEWKNVVGLMKGTSVWEEVKKRYPELKTDDDIADEVLATYSGRRGAERLREEMDNAKGDAKGVLQRVKEAIERFWKATADMLHIHYKSAEEVADRVMKDLLDGVDPRKMGEPHEGGYNLHKVTDKEELEKLDKEKTFRMYSSMQEVDGKLYSPMAAIIGGKRSDAAEIGAWMKADEHPELVKDGKFTLVKTDGKKGLGEGDVGAAYNPYMHTSSSMMNDQFTGAYARGNIKVVEWEVPENEKTSGYHAEGAKNSVGIVPWHSGSVNGLLPKERQRSVMLSRYRKGVRVVPDSEVAEKIANQLRGTGLAIPWNVVTPNQLEELAKIGVPITTEESGTQAKETKAKFEAQKAELEEKYPQARFVNVKMTKEAHKEWGKDGGTRYRKGEAPEESVLRDNATKRKAVDETVKKSGSKVNVHESVDDIDNPEVKSAIERGENVKGWYDTKTGEVHLYMPNVTDKYDTQKTIAHETIGHKGMRGLLGEQGYRELMRNLYTHMSKEEAAEVNRLMMENGWDFYTAMDEYVADKAEDMVWNPKAATFWENVKHYVTEAINRIGYRIKPNVNDVKYWLWESKRALNNGDALNSMKRNSFLWKLRRGQKARLDDIVSFNGKDGVTDEDVLQVRQLYKKGSLKPDKNDTPLTSATKQAIDDALNSASFKRNECWMDSKHGLKVLIDNMGKGLKKGMNSSMDAYHGAINQSSIVAEKQENMNRQQLATLNDKVKDCTLKLGGGERGYEDLNRYVYAKSGLERNRVLLVRDTAEKIDRKIKEINKAIALDAKAKGEEPKLLSMSAVELFRDGRFREEKEWQDELLKKGKISLTEYCGNLDHCIKTFQFAHTGDKEFDEHINDLNNWIREEIQDKYDPNKNDYSGILSMTEFHDGDEVNEANIIDFVMQTENTLGEDSVKELWSSIREVTQFSLDNDYNYGLIDKSAHDRASSMFTFYVPMRGFKDGSAEDSYAYMRDENSGANAGNTLIHAKGRTTLGESIFGTMANLAQRSISRGEDNKNKQRLYRLAYQWVKDHTDESGNLTEEPPMIVSDVWYVKKRDETTGEEYWEPELPNIDDEMSEKAVRAKIERFEQNMQNAEKNGTATRVAPKARYDKPFKVADHKNEHIVFVKIGGKTKMVIFPGNPRPAQAINGDTQFGGNQNKLMRAMAAAFTSYNPTFLVSNTARDTIFAHNNVSIRESAQYLARFTKNQAMLLSGIKQKDGETGRRNKAGYYGLLTKYKKGIKPETKLEEYFKEFMDNGGRTGFVKAKTIKDLEEEIKNNAIRGKIEESITKALLYLPEVIETANARFENANRFAAYLTSRQEGRSVMRSVSDAKEVSTNFNRSGAGSKAYKNAGRLEKMSGYTYDFFRNTKLFFNAGMQSLAILSTNVKNHPWKTVATTVASSMVAGGLIIPALNYLIAYATGEDDMYSELPEWDRRNNICIYLTHGSFLKIPLPIEIRGFYGLGDVALGAMRPEYRSNAGIALDALKQLTQILPIDFMGDGSGVIGSLLPTVIQPVYHTIVNKDWTGKSLYKDTPYNQNDPEYTKAFKSENDWLVGISKLINSASGGTDDTKGVLDHKYMNNPAVWGELISGYTGGAGSDALRATGFASRVFKMDWSDFSTREIPLLRGFISTPTERTKYYRSLNRYYKYKEDAEKYGHDLNKSLKSSDPMVRNRALRDIYEKKPEYIMYQKVNNLEKELSRKRQSIKALNPSEEQKKIYQDQMNDKKVDLVYELEGRERKEAKDKDKK